MAMVATSGPFPEPQRPAYWWSLHPIWPENDPYPAIGAGSASAVGRKEGKAKRHERHDGRDQREVDAPRPAHASGLEQEAQENDQTQIDPGEDGEQLALVDAALFREVADAERCDQDVEHQHNRVHEYEEQPAVRTESVNRNWAEAVPRQPE